MKDGTDLALEEKCNLPVLQNCFFLHCQPASNAQFYFYIYELKIKSFLLYLKLICENKKSDQVGSFIYVILLKSKCRESFQFLRCAGFHLAKPSRTVILPITCFEICTVHTLVLSNINDMGLSMISEAL